MEKLKDVLYDKDELCYRCGMYKGDNLFWCTICFKELKRKEKDD